MKRENLDSLSKPYEKLVGFLGGRKKQKLLLSPKLIGVDLEVS